MGVSNVDFGPSLAVLSDCELVDAVRAGDDEAYEELYRRHHRRVVGYVRAMLGDRGGGAEDVTQEAFISGLQGLRVTQAKVAFKPWIFAIARNACIDLLRRARIEQLQVDTNGANGAALVEAPAEAPDAELARRERFDYLVAALDELAEQHKSVLVMRELEGRSSGEIAKRAGLTRPAVESALFRARRELRETYAALEAGTRCREMTASIARMAEGLGSRRERRRVERHAHRCAHCRRQARKLGVELGAPVVGRLAGLLPLPWLFRDSGRRFPDNSWVLAAPQGSDAAGVALAKLVATVAAVALLGGVVGREVLEQREEGAAGAPGFAGERSATPAPASGGGSVGLAGKSTGAAVESDRVPDASPVEPEAAPPAGGGGLGENALADPDDVTPDPLHPPLENPVPPDPRAETLIDVLDGELRVGLSLLPEDPPEVPAEGNPSADLSSPDAVKRPVPDPGPPTAQ